MKVTEKVITRVAAVQPDLYLTLYAVETSISRYFFSHCYLFSIVICLAFWLGWTFFFLASVFHAVFHHHCIITCFFIVMLGDFLCTRARRAGINRCDSKFRLQRALSKTPDFWAVGFWGKTWLLVTERITCALIRHRVHPWCSILLGHFQGCLHNNVKLLLTKFFGCNCDVLVMLTVCLC